MRAYRYADVTFTLACLSRFRAFWLTESDALMLDDKPGQWPEIVFCTRDEAIAIARTDLESKTWRLFEGRLPNELSAYQPVAPELPKRDV